MCGIAGFYDLREVALAERVRAMTDRLRHRGPNAAGILLAGTDGATAWAESGAVPDGVDLALGHRRLSILDLSDAGRQPMASASGRQWLVFNGEIYNYVELRDELIQRGHQFRTGTDTEVLLAAYAEWGIECLSRCNGMWAFALWDADLRRLFLARDRMGVKPLFFAHGVDWLVFGSEIKALLAHPRVPRRPNPAIVYDFLSLRLSDHTAETFFADIERVPAGHYLEIEPGRGVRAQRYWAVTPTTSVSCSEADEAHAISRFHELFVDAVRIRLRADVPLGTCLSGGLDSSSIAVVVNDLLFRELDHDRATAHERQHTFSACFDDPRFDERSFIDQVVATTGAASHRVFPAGERLWDELPALVAQMDEPFHSTSQYSQYSVMRLVKDSGITVTLDGQGADELMAGYPTYHSVMLATLLGRGHGVRAAREAVASVRASGRGRGALELLARTAYALTPPQLSTPLRTAVAPYLSSYSPEGRSLRVIRPELHAAFAERRESWIAERAAASHDLARRLHDDLFRFSLPPLLRYADRNSMAFSIESRMPFLDYRLVEHVCSLPMSLLVRNGWTKWILRRAMNGRLPRPVQWRKDKMGFVTPEGAWLRAGADRLTAALSGGLASAEFLDGGQLRQLLGGSLIGTGDGARYTDVFRWYILELWMRHAFA